jgi:hypothetical protein
MAKKKQTHGYVVVQQGGASNEVYVHAFDTSKDAGNYRRSCKRSSYACSESIKVPVAVISTATEVAALEEIAQATAKLVYGQ